MPEVSRLILTLALSVVHHLTPTPSTGMFTIQAPSGQALACTCTVRHLRLAVALASNTDS